MGRSTKQKQNQNQNQNSEHQQASKQASNKQQQTSSMSCFGFVTLRDDDSVKIYRTKNTGRFNTVDELVQDIVLGGFLAELMCAWFDEGPWEDHIKEYEAKQEKEKEDYEEKEYWTWDDYFKEVNQIDTREKLETFLKDAVDHMFDNVSPNILTFDYIEGIEIGKKRDRYDESDKDEDMDDRRNKKIKVIEMD